MNRRRIRRTTTAESGETAATESRLTPRTVRRLIVGLGLSIVVLAVGFPALPAVEESSIQLRVALGLLAGVPGLIVAFGGYRLPRADVHPELYATVLVWCLRGIAVGLSILVLVLLVSGDSPAVLNGILLAGLGSLAGLAAGVYDARAKTRERELRATIEKLRTSNERLAQFTRAASHDLQEPLRMVSSYLQLIEQRYAEDLDEDGQEYLEFAVDGADRMRAMIDSLLEYSQVTARGGSLEPTDAGAVLERVRDDLDERITATDATITAEELPTVLADELQLEQVFRQLLTNAIQFSGETQPSIHVSAERSGDVWELSVADEGIGIDPAYHDRIFEVFERVHDSDQGPPTDTGGIGLALCERIVERHGGTVRVESEPGDGSTFTFTVPAVNHGNG